MHVGFQWGRLPVFVGVVSVLLCLTSSAWSQPAPGGQAEQAQRAGTYSGWVGEGLPSQTPYFVRTADQEGPTVLIIGGMHGNEPAGAEAADQIRHWPIERGRLVVVPRANPPALDQDVRRIPGKPRDEGDLNRNFPATNSDRGPVGPTAEQLWAFIQEIRPDWILDLHEGGDFLARNPRSVGSSIIHYDDEITTPLALKMLAAVNREVDEDDKIFMSVPRGPVETGMVRATIHFLNAHGMVLETTRPDQPLSVRVRQHRMMVHTLLNELDMYSGPAHVVFESIEQLGEHDSEPVLRVALYDGPGTGGDGVNLLASQLGAMERTKHLHISAADIRDGVLDQFDVVLFPGGRGGRQGQELSEKGREQVRTFVEHGGGYIGICAGAYLATCRLGDYLNITKAYHGQPWQRGRGLVEIELTDIGQEILGSDQTSFTLRYANGPVLKHELGLEPDLDLPDYEVLARFTRGVERDGERDTAMEGTPAIVASQYGMGRILLISPHPESSEDTAWMVAHALRWVGMRPQPVLTR